MKKFIMMAVMLGLSGTAYTEPGTMKTLLVSAGIDSPEPVQDKLKAMYEDGTDVWWSDLIDYNNTGFLSALYDVQGIHGDRMKLYVGTSSQTDPTTCVSLYGEDRDYGTAYGVSGTNSAKIVKTGNKDDIKSTVKVKKMEDGGKTYLVIKHSYSASLFSSDHDYKVYGLLVVGSTLSS